MMTLLVLTTGQTDVQLVVDGGRKEFKKERCARLHEELERRSDWHILDAPAMKLRGEVEELPAGTMAICTPKLDAVLAYLAAGDLDVTNALILETRRNPESAPGDPRAAGTVLARRLLERLGERLDVQRATLLQGSERLENPTDPRDAVIRREVVARLDQAIREATDKISRGRIVVATTGGLPIIAALAEEAVGLHAGIGTEVEMIEVADGAKAAPPTKDRAVARRAVPEPAESYRARRHALDLIERGNLLGAWGTAEHLHDDEVEQQWTRVVEWLARFAASLPLPKECDIPVLTHKHMAVRAGIRVDLALRAGDVPRAVHGTVAFFEAALWDHLSRHLVPHPKRRRQFRVSPAPPESLVRSEGVDENENRRRPFKVVATEDGIMWYWIFDDDVCAVRLAGHYIQRCALQKLGQVVSEKVRELRNDVAHNEPTPRLMDDARRRMAEAGLWSSHGRFLTQKLIKDVLNELGEEDSENLCESLIATARDRLRDVLIPVKEPRGAGHGSQPGHETSAGRTR